MFFGGDDFAGESGGINMNTQRLLAGGGVNGLVGMRGLPDLRCLPGMQGDLSGFADYAQEKCDNLQDVKFLLEGGELPEMAGHVRQQNGDAMRAAMAAPQRSVRQARAKAAAMHDSGRSNGLTCGDDSGDEEAADESAAKRNAITKEDEAEMDDEERRKLEHRRAKNRRTAAISRQRRRALMDSLQTRIRELESENAELRQVAAVRSRELTLLRDIIQDLLSTQQMQASPPHSSGMMGVHGGAGTPGLSPDDLIHDPDEAAAAAAALGGPGDMMAVAMQRHAAMGPSGGVGKPQRQMPGRIPGMSAEAMAAFVAGL